MADYYYDFLNGDNANPGTESQPKKNITSPISTATGGDRHLFKRGVTIYVSEAGGNRLSISGTVGTSKAAPCYFGAYGTGPNPVFDCGGYNQYGIWPRNCSHIVIEDLDVTNSRANGIRISHASAGSVLTDITMRRCRAYGNNLDAALGHDEIYVHRIAGGGSLERIRLEYCDAFDSPANGMKFRSGVVDSVMIGCRAWNCGWGELGHGMGTAGYGYAVTSWSLISGTTYEGTFTPANVIETAAVTTLDGVFTTTGNYGRLALSGTPSTPGLGEYGIPAANTIRVNVGAAPGSVYIAKGPPKRNILFGCSARGIIDYNGEEGHGIAFDDFSEDCYAIGCRSFDNQGAAFQMNRGRRGGIIGSLGHGNQKGALIVGNDGVKIYNSTISAGDADLYAILGGYRATLDVRNAILIGGAYGIDVQGGATYTEANNCFHGQSIASIRDGGATPSVDASSFEADPLLSSSFRPAASSPCRGAAQYIRGVRHFGGTSMNPASPDIGAHRFFERRDVATSLRVALLRG